MRKSRGAVAAEDTCESQNRRFLICHWQCLSLVRTQRALIRKVTSSRMVFSIHAAIPDYQRHPRRRYSWTNARHGRPEVEWLPIDCAFGLDGTVTAGYAIDDLRQGRFSSSSVCHSGPAASASARYSAQKSALLEGVMPPEDDGGTRWFEVIGGEFHDPGLALSGGKKACEDESASGDNADGDEDGEKVVAHLRLLALLAARTIPLPQHQHTPIALIVNGKMRIMRK